jgi:hypothetical protein
MKRSLALTLAFALTVVQFASISAQLVGAGIITGTISGPSGPLAGITVQVLDGTGTIAGSAVTTEAGAFSITGLGPGTFTVQAVGANGAIIGASTATLVEGAMTVAVTVNAAAGALAASAAAAAGAAATTGAAAASTTVLAAIGAAAAAVGTAAVIATNEEASGSR